MRSLLNNQNGIIYVSIIFIALIIFVILTSLVYIMSTNIEVINSNNDSYRANYISESILELKIMQIMELSDRVIIEYLLDLQKYKKEYIKDINNNPSVKYDPPKFSIYVEQKIIPNIKKLGSNENNPFEEYEDDHYYKIDIEYDSGEKVINITSTGIYNRARRFIKAKLELPKIIENGFDEYNLPKVSILPVSIVEYYQTIGL
ncbi:hypothetical protein [Alkaliphilus sp. B6464]|uniref:hypothetical protein n=1 Tax=Alkaliphilus sp. B6464 TaxID=2731219 RepID=UPI001BA7E960|nr:hypothetical protein [Alkaliphilus sp. B6464]QUH20683.1 hypothetical protein HYG84_12935 [Alkaliphilus sp. B6464]